MTRDEQIASLERGVGALITAVEALGENRFHEPVTSWTTRDIVAHLIGWNRHVIRGAGQILEGELPFYDVDPGPDYEKINAVLVRQYDERSRSKLLDELNLSLRELTTFLRALDPGQWDRDLGVRHRGETLTVRSTVDDLIADYRHHQRQIEELETRTGRGR